MYKRLFIMSLLILIIFSIGCGQKGPDPRELGRSVIKSLQDKDVEAYLNNCLTIADKKFMIVSLKLSLKEKTAQMALIPTSRRDIYETNDMRTANFNDIASLAGWEKAVINKISLKKRIKEDGILFYEGIIVKFKQSVLPDLKIGRIVSVKGQWKIMDAKALTFLSMI